MGISLRQPESYFSSTLQVRCPPILPPAVERAASLNLMTSSEYVRRCIIDRLKADGVKLQSALDACAQNPTVVFPTPTPVNVPAAKFGGPVAKKGKR
jgi:hypothetical protein